MLGQCLEVLGWQGNNQQVAGVGLALHGLEG